MRVLDVGCGPNKRPGAVGIDRVACPGVDVVHNLDQFPYPFPDGAFDRILFNHSLEHLRDIVAVMAEVHRIGAAGALVEIHTPHFSSADAYTDITHLHFFGMRSFDYFTAGGMYNYYHPTARFEIVEQELIFWVLSDRWLSIIPHRWLGIRWFAHRFPTIYERFLAWIFPARALRMVLRVMK